MAISFWTRAGVTIGSLRQVYWEYEDYRGGLEEGFVQQGAVKIREADGSERVLSPKEVDGDYLAARSVVHNLRPLLSAIPYDIHDLIPEAARIVGGEELAVGVRKIYQEFQIARAEAYFGINFRELASKE